MTKAMTGWESDRHGLGKLPHPYLWDTTGHRDQLLPLGAQGALFF